MSRVLGSLLAFLAAANYSQAVDDSSSGPLSESWSYTYYFYDRYSYRYQEFLGIADSEANLYWIKCNQQLGVPWVLACFLRSTDWDGKLRFELPLGEGVPSYGFRVDVRLIAGQVLITSSNYRLVSSPLYARATLDGSLLWTHDLHDDLPQILGIEAGVAHDGGGRLLVTANGVDQSGPWLSAILAISAETGQTIWIYEVPREYPTDATRVTGAILDEAGNAYFTEVKNCMGCKWFIASLDPNGSLRFRNPSRVGLVPIAAAHGRVVVWSWSDQLGELLDAATGATIARFAGLLDGSALISRGLGFFIEDSGSLSRPIPATRRAALAAFDLANGEIRWRFPLGNFELRQGPVLTDQGNILVLDGSSLLEISPQGELLRATRLRYFMEHPSVGTNGISLLIKGRWFSQSGPTVLAHDVPGAPGEARLGWNSRYGDAQHDNRARDE